MSIGSIFGNALTGLQASQSALKVVSQNVSNANTPGYVRAEVRLSPQVIAGGGAGVQIDAVTRAADRFLAAAERAARGTQGALAARTEFLDRAQAVFGDPNGSQTLFTAIDDVFSAIGVAGQDATSSTARRNALAAIDDLLGEFSRAAQAIENLRLEADQRLGEAATRASGLIQRIADLNGEVAFTRQSGGDATTAESARDQLIDELSTLIDLRLTPRSDGTVEVRTTNGATLVGTGAATLSYSDFATPFGLAGGLVIDAGRATEGQFDPAVGNGLIAGLMRAREIDLPGLGDALASLAAATADALNAAHQATAGYPAASTLAGRQTGLLASDSLNFSGSAVLGVLDSDGVLVRRITIDFDAGTITTENPADTRSFTNSIGNLVTRLDEALQLSPAQGTAAFSNGVLTVSGGSGLVVGDDASDPSARAGRSFAHFFGLNDLVRSPAPLFHEAGVAPSDAHGLAGAISFEITDTNGRVILERSVAAAGTTWTDYIAALNNTATGIGQYATASLDANGRLVVTPRTGYVSEVAADTTARGSTGVSASELFGLARATTATRGVGLVVNDAIARQPSKLGLGLPDLTASIGARILEGGDARGAAALAAVRDATRSFGDAGALPAQTTTLSLYASRLAGEAGRAADQSLKAQEGADAVLTAATERRAQSEGVSLDEELIRMTQYQQSYAAASRLIQAARDMFDILMNIA